MCFSPQRRAIFQHLNFKKWSEPDMFCAFSLQNVLLVTAACNFSTSQLSHHMGRDNRDTTNTSFDFPSVLQEHQTTDENHQRNKHHHTKTPERKRKITSEAKTPRLASEREQTAKRNSQVLRLPSGHLQFPPSHKKRNKISSISQKCQRNLSLAVHLPQNPWQ